VGAVGYCWGGAIADLAACRTGVAAAVSYYGRANVAWLNERPRCPIQYHFGAKDPLIPPEIVEQITRGRPGAPAYVYADAGHGFSCDERPEFHRPSHELALQRTLAFLDQHLAS
jgi:carboxymethylenebutenolidase